MTTYVWRTDTMTAWKLDADSARLLDRVDAIAREVIAPAAGEVDRTACFPQAALGALREGRLLGLISAKKIGGQGQGLRAAVATVERIARECPSTAMIVTMHYCGTRLIELFGPEEIRRSIAEKGNLATLAFSETGSRSHFWMPVSSARRDGTGFVLDAQKQLTTSAGYADWYVWSSRPVAEEGLSTIWLVPSDAEGLSVTARYEGMGLRGNSSAPIVAVGVRMLADNLLHGDGKGWEVMQQVLPFFSLQSCGVSLGMMEGAFERAVKHVTSATFSYDGSKLSDLPQVRGHVARMKLRIDMLRGFLLDAVDAVEQQRDDAMVRVLEAKLAGAETALEVLDLAMRVCGGAAFRKDVAVERFFRDSRAATVMAPVSDALYEMIGKSLCGLQVFE